MVKTLEKMLHKTANGIQWETNTTWQPFPDS